MENGSTSSSEKYWKAPANHPSFWAQPPSQLQLKTLRTHALQNVLPPKFYARDTVAVAKELLGKILIVRSRPATPFENPTSLITAGRIVETEAYHGNDPASHSCRGKTERCAIMFGEPGIAYVYFIYGMYEMLNFVTEPKGYPGAVLIRALEPLYGTALMQKRRNKVPASHLTNGPGRLSMALGIRRTHKGQSLQGPALFVADDGLRPACLLASPRVGIQQGKETLWRFFVAGHPCVSQVRENSLARMCPP